MKRRTRKSDQNGRQHKEAFDHAYQVMKPLAKKRARNEKPHHNRLAERIRFTVDIELEKGGTIEVGFCRTTGFRLTGNLGMAWETIGLHPEHHRDAKKRLEAYRTKLIRWQHLHENGTLTFRHFNLLLAALCYGVSNP